jgi:hypothetical protein
MDTNRRLIVHDLQEDAAAAWLPAEAAGLTLFAAAPSVHYCIGCFGCWIKTPGRCVIPDRGAEIATLFAAQDEIVVFSRLVFGGLSPDAKAVLDRSIGNLLPYFREANREMHHALRHERIFALRYVFYGSDITEAEKATAKKLAVANALNYGSELREVSFYQSAQEAGAALKAMGAEETVQIDSVDQIEQAAQAAEVLS